MRLIIRPSANKDVKKLPKAIKQDVKTIVLQMIESETLNDKKNIKRLKGHVNAYRIRIKEYRMGFFLEGDTIILSRILHRKDVYRYFP